MKCLIRHCSEPRDPRSLHFCVLHGDRYIVDHRAHFDARAVTKAISDSWLATWIQMVDLELQNALVAPPAPPKSSYFTYPKISLPLVATKAGQVQVKRELKEMDLLEAQLALDVVEYTRGRRMELEYELREKRKKK